ncbi:hypothetical protein NQ317_010242 [Molorchus minor]|uniref:Uncharacterized protein n=1 Tax=Molorchus minor TaxID=1323400 RepID=A0ABQ9JIA0_9CUCU|nr:hypothetical protein NQ317_010242 [Molorchus minor]
MEEWTRTVSSNCAKNMFPRLLNKLVPNVQCNSVENIKAGFMECGICPINRQKVLDMLPSLPVVADTENVESEIALTNSFTDLLKTMRYTKTPKSPRKKNKRLEVTPGKSIAFDDFDKENTEQIIKSEDSLEDLPLFNSPKVASEESSSDLSENMPLSDLTNQVSKETIDQRSMVLANKKDIQVDDWLLVCFKPEVRCSKQKALFFICKVLNTSQTDEEKNSPETLMGLYR